MSKLLGSKVGYLTAGIYLLVTLPVIVAASFIFVLRYSVDNVHDYPIEGPINIGVIVLTIPWSLIATFAALFFPMHTGRFVFVVGLVIGAIINASIFYLLGRWFSMGVTYFSGSEKPNS